MLPGPLHIDTDRDRNAGQDDRRKPPPSLFHMPGARANQIASALVLAIASVGGMVWFPQLGIQTQARSQEFTFPSHGPTTMGHRGQHGELSV